MSLMAWAKQIAETNEEMILLLTILDKDTEEIRK